LAAVAYFVFNFMDLRLRRPVMDISENYFRTITFALHHHVLRKQHNYLFLMKLHFNILYLYSLFILILHILYRYIIQPFN